MEIITNFYNTSYTYYYSQKQKLRLFQTTSLKNLKFIGRPNFCPK